MATGGGVTARLANLTAVQEIKTIGVKRFPFVNYIVHYICIRILRRQALAS
jgi:hypothetical protein